MPVLQIFPEPLRFLDGFLEVGDQDAGVILRVQRLTSCF